MLVISKGWKGQRVSLYKVLKPKSDQNMYACTQLAGWPDGHFRSMSIQEHYLYKCLDIFIKEKALQLDSKYLLNPYAMPFKPRQRKNTANEKITELLDAGGYGRAG